MTEVSRTKKSLKNSIVALIYLSIVTILNFYSRKVFLDYLGTEILGLNTTASNILQFCNLAELGIGTAVGFSLYKPLYNNDHKSINEITTLHGYIYKRVAILIIAIAIVLMFFFPTIFRKMQLPLWYAYATFGALLFSSLLGYFVNYRQVVLSSAQLDYKIQYSYKTWVLIKTIVQMIAVSTLKNPYEWWLVCELVFPLIASISLHKMTKRTFTYLETVNQSYRDLKTKYSVILIKIKQVFLHRLAGFALTQTSSLIIYAYFTLTLVTIYGNYLIVILGLQSICSAVFNSMSAGIGNLVAEGNKKKIISVFAELFSIRFFIGCVITYSFVVLVQPFIILWIGDDYKLPNQTICLMAISMFIYITRNTVDIFIAAYGLYQDVWAPITEAILNVSMSIILGKIMGLNGIILGAIVSQFIIVLLWKPYFLFTKGLKSPLCMYISMYIKHIMIAMIFSFGAYMFVITNNFVLDTWTRFILYAGGIIISYSIILFSIFIFLGSDLKQFLKRIKV